jgi:hypothetical protein
MEERLAAHVEDSGLLLDDAGPGTDLGQHIGDVVEQRGRAIRHG